MTVFTLVVAVFLAGVRLMTSGTSRIRSTADSATAARGALDVLSRQLSFASATNTPVRSGRAWYLEFQTDAVKGGSDPTCTQWRYDAGTGMLQWRQWSLVTLAPGGWVTAARGLVNDPDTQPPFTLAQPDTRFRLMRMVVDLHIRTASGPTLQTQGQYTMRNAAEAPVPGANTVCSQAGRP